MIHTSDLKKETRSVRDTFMLICIMTVICTLISPTIAYEMVEENYQENLSQHKEKKSEITPEMIQQMKQQMKDGSNFTSAIKNNWNNLTVAEQKMDSNLLYLIYLQKNSEHFADEFLVKFWGPTYIIPAPPQVERIKEKIPDIIFLKIYMNTANSTHILDPYLYKEYNRDEGSGVINAWVDISKIMDIANLSEVSRINRVSLALFNVGSVETEGNSTLHSKDILDLPNGPDGEGISIGIISDGMNNLSEAVTSGDLPDNVRILSNGTGNKGIAMAEIIHDIAPKASLFFMLQ